MFEFSYSPLCDVDSDAYARYYDAYIQYLSARAGRDGDEHLRGVSLDGGEDVSNRRLGDFARVVPLLRYDAQDREVESGLGINCGKGDVRQDVCDNGVSGSSRRSEVVSDDVDDVAGHGEVSGWQDSQESGDSSGCAIGQNGLGGSHEERLNATEAAGTPRGKNFARNKAKRQAKKSKQKKDAMDRDWRGRFVSVGERFKSNVDVDVEMTDLQKSSELKWKMQNELAAEKARRELEVLKKTDLDKEYKRYNTKLQVATERNMVAIEKTHATLAATGNVPEAFHGSVHTVVDGEIVGEVPSLVEGGCTISPDSSASMAEYRACQKKNLDLEAKLEKYVALTGVPVENVDDFDKHTWTDTAENEERLDIIYPDGFGKTPHPFHDGKFQVVRCSY